MKINTTAIEGVHIVELDELTDDRGFFARSYCRDEFVAAGLEPTIAQCNLSRNHVAGTLRGMHFQTMEAPEVKFIRCTRGAILDVVVDMRAGSPTLGEHVAVELTEENHQAIYVPAVFAHGYLTLTDDAEVHYQVSHPYTPNTERGLLHDDPILGIDWPRSIDVISDKDKGWATLGSRQDLESLAQASGGAS